MRASHTRPHPLSMLFMDAFSVDYQILIKVKSLEKLIGSPAEAIREATN